LLGILRWTRISSGDLGLFCSVVNVNSFIFTLQKKSQFDKETRLNLTHSLVHNPNLPNSTFLVVQIQFDVPVSRFKCIPPLQTNQVSQGSTSSCCLTMGNAPSQAIDPTQKGFHILRVRDHSPAYEAGLKAYFDFVTHVNGKSLVCFCWVSQGRPSGAPLPKSITQSIPYCFFTKNDEGQVLMCPFGNVFRLRGS
jgi:hypothetical protein